MGKKGPSWTGTGIPFLAFMLLAGLTLAAPAVWGAYSAGAPETRRTIPPWNSCERPFLFFSTSLFVVWLAPVLVP